MLNNIKKSGGGFTIIELMVTIFFISVGIIGALTAIQLTTTYTDNATHRLTAVYLAQEGIEIARNIRDGNWLEGNPWDRDLNDGNYEADYLSQSLSGNYAGDFLLHGGFYNYTSGNTTLFKRKITISDKDDLDGDGAADRMRVKALVSWELKGAHEISAEEFLYNWR